MGAHGKAMMTDTAHSATVDLSVVAEALAADLRSKETPGSPLSDMLDGLAATFEAALTGCSPLTLRNAQGDF